MLPFAPLIPARRPPHAHPSLPGLLRSGPRASRPFPHFAFPPRPPQVYEIRPVVEERPEIVYFITKLQAQEKELAGLKALVSELQDQGRGQTVAYQTMYALNDKTHKKIRSLKLRVGDLQEQRELIIPPFVHLYRKAKGEPVHAETLNQAMEFGRVLEEEMAAEQRARERHVYGHSKRKSRRPKALAPARFQALRLRTEGVEPETETVDPETYREYRAAQEDLLQYPVRVAMPLVLPEHPLPPPGPPPSPAPSPPARRDARECPSL